MTTRLARELALLYAVEATYKIPAAPAVRQLIAADERPLPDVIPLPPHWVEFEWPASGLVSLQEYWYAVDNKSKLKGKHVTGLYSPYL